MEALRDRTVKIDIPYITSSPKSSEIYAKDYNAERIRGKHIAPHTLEMAAMWAVLTRLEDPKKHNLTLLQKLKLYDGKTLPGFTAGQHQGAAQGGRCARAWTGSRRATSRTRSPTRWSRDKGEGCVNPFMVLNELESGLRHHSLITQRRAAASASAMLLRSVKQEYEDIVKNEVQRAI